VKQNKKYLINPVYQKIGSFFAFSIISSLIFILKILGFILKSVFLIFRKIFGLISYKFLRLFFYKIIVKFYSFYISILNKVGWKKIKGNLIKYLLGQKLAHIVVVLVTTFFVFTNLAYKTKADTLVGQSSRTIISTMISSEFGSVEDDPLIEEINEQGFAGQIARQSYLENDATLKNKPRTNEESISDTNIKINTSDTNETNILLTRPEVKTQNNIIKKRTETINYVVESGDSVSTIAKKFGISVNTILWENNLSSYSLIRPGDELRILPLTGISHKIKNGETLSSISIDYAVEIDDILLANNITKNSTLRLGRSLLIPDGSKKVYSQPKIVQRSISGIAAIKKIVSPDTQKVASNKMAWPTVGNRITQYYSWRHTGLDIANKLGTPLFAADSGTVEFVGWSTGYGNNVVINHGGGKKTRYAHMHKFYVGKGEQVDKGEAIGEMGSTGWSTGPHIHFEVIINGIKYNPLNYLR